MGFWGFGVLGFRKEYRKGNRQSITISPQDLKTQMMAILTVSSKVP